MGARTFAAFGLGFAAGVVCLAIALWAAGRLPVRPAAVPTPPSLVSQPLPEAPAIKPSIPPQVPFESPAGLAMPIEGIDPMTLHDTFQETHKGHPHEALDIMAPRGTPVHAAVQGNVVKLFTSKQGGLTVYQFDDSRTLCYYYAHLDRYAPGLKEGTLLRRGDVLGYVGSTGDASPDAPHLHFAIFRLGPEKEWWKGTAVDPLPLLQSRPSAP
jgi:peptidoglycan LD-endopeptidase LytH